MVWATLEQFSLLGYNYLSRRKSCILDKKYFLRSCLLWLCPAWGAFSHFNLQRVKFLTRGTHTSLTTEYRTWKTAISDNHPKRQTCHSEQNILQMLTPTWLHTIKTIIPLNYNTIQHLINLLHFHRPRVQGLKEESQQDCTVKTNPGFMNMRWKTHFHYLQVRLLCRKLHHQWNSYLQDTNWLKKYWIVCVEGFQQVQNSVGGLDFFSFVQQTLVWRHFLAGSSWNCPRVHWADINLDKLWFYDGAYDGEIGKLWLKTNFQ